MNNADEFLHYIADNEKRLKYNLSKNITYNADIFDDVFQDTVVKCYDTIVKNNVMVDDFTRYFFIAAKWNYINTDNKTRRHKSVMNEIGTVKIDTEYFIDETEEVRARQMEIDRRYADMVDLLISEYGYQNTNMFLEYYTGKTQGDRTSYKKIAQMFNLPHKTVAETIKGIHQFLTSNSLINNLES